MKELTTALKLLVAAGKLSASGKASFSAEEIVVTAHGLFRDEFALKGYPQIPDSNKVYKELMGKRAPLIVRGWLEKVGMKQYRLTPKGAADVNAIDAEGSHERNTHIERLQEDEFGRILTSDVFELFRGGQQEGITFHQFCRFAGLSARDKRQTVAHQMERLAHSVKAIVTLGESGQGLKINYRMKNYKFSPEELRTVVGLYKYLTERFQSQMDEWKKKPLGLAGNPNIIF